MLVSLHLKLQIMSFDQPVLLFLSPVFDPIRVAGSFKVIPFKEIQSGLVSLGKSVYVLLMGVSETLNVLFK